MSGSGWQTPGGRPVNGNTSRDENLNLNQPAPGLRAPPGTREGTPERASEVVTENGTTLTNGVAHGHRQERDAADDNATTIREREPNNGRLSNGTTRRNDGR